MHAQTMTRHRAWAPGAGAVGEGGSVGKGGVVGGTGGTGGTAGVAGEAGGEAGGDFIPDIGIDGHWNRRTLE